MSAGEELHIAGIVVHARAEGTHEAGCAIARLPGAEVHATSADGRLVVTLEASGARGMAELMDEIRRLDGVISASLVYQHNEPLAAMMEELNETHET